MIMVKAKLNYFRMSPRKVRSVARLLKGLKVKEAEKKLLYLPKRSSRAILKLLKSAVSNAKNKGLQEEKLYIKNVVVNEGPKYKRYRPDSRGTVSLITKRTSHIELVLEEHGS